MEELKEMCRLCMAETEDLLDMYDEKKTHIEDRLSEALKNGQEPEPSFPDLLKEFSPICVKSDDQFPKKVCDSCVRNLRDAVYFCKRYSKSINYVSRVKVENNDQAILNDLEQEEWDLPAKSDNEEEDEDEEGEEDEEDDEDEDEDQENKGEDEDEEDEEDEDYSDELEDFEDDEEEYLPVAKKRKTKLGLFECPDCPKTFTTQAQLTLHSGDHSKESTKQNGTNSRPKRRSAKY